MGALLGELAALVRDLLIRKTAPEGGQGLLTGGYEERTIRQLLQRFTSGELVQIMTLCREHRQNCTVAAAGASTLSSA